MQNFNHGSNNVVGGSSNALDNNTKNKSNAAQSTVVINDNFTKSSSLHCRHRNHAEHVTNKNQQEEEECKKLNREEPMQNKYEPKRRRVVWWRRALSNMLFRQNKKHYNVKQRKEIDNSDSESSSSSSSESSSTTSSPSMYVDKNNEGNSELYNVQSYNEYHHHDANADELRAARLRERRQQVRNSTYRQNKKQNQEKYKLSSENECDWKCCLWCAIGILLIGMVCIVSIFYVLYIHDESFREWLHSFHVMKSEKHVYAKINGWSSLEHPELLPSLQIRLPRKMSAKELLAKYKSVDFVYTYVNGSEPNHVYRKLIWDACGAEMLEKEELLYAETMETDTNRSHVDSDNRNNDTTRSYECTSHDLFTLPTTREVLEYIQHQSERSVNSRDRDWDELKYSIRSVEQNIAWHRGRLLIVSPGHIPHWLHLARNFFGNNSLHTSTMTEYVERSNWLTEKTNIINSYHHFTLVHQDALLPHYMHMTFNSHVIEEHLWRLRNLSAMHIYFNDDYFVNRPVSITDFFNEYGGAVIRTESKKIKQAVRAHSQSISWIDSVKHVHLFATVELDVHAEDYLPPSLALKWSEAIMEESQLLHKTSKHNTLPSKEEMKNNELTLHSIRVPATLLEHWIDVALHDPPPPSLPWSITPRDLAMLHKLNQHQHHNYFSSFLQEKSKEHEREEVSLEKQYESEMIDKNTSVLVESSAVSDTDSQYEEEEEESSQLLLLSTPSEVNSKNTLHDKKKEKKENAPEKTKKTRATNKLTAKEKKAIIQLASSRKKKSEEKSKEGRWHARWAQTHLPTHAPFVYCTNMFRYFATRYERELSHVDYYNRKRMANNYLMPLMYSAFALSRPWQASPSFLPYLMQHHKMIDVKSFTEVYIEEDKNNTTITYTAINNNKLLPSSEVEWVIDLNNDDGCAPITQLVGNASDTLYTKLTDDKVLTAITATRLQRHNPLFFNINAGCNSSECAKYMYLLLESKYASPIYLDYDDELVHEPNASDVLVNDALYSLMQLPLIVLTSFDENICPLIRSLQFAMPAFTGDIYVFVEEVIEEDGININATNRINSNLISDNNYITKTNEKGSKCKLEQIRNAYHFTLRSAAPVLGCTYNDKVHINYYYHKFNSSSTFRQNSDIEQIVTQLLHPQQHNNSAFVNRNDDIVKLPSFLNTSYANKTISAFLIDTRIALPAELHVSEQAEEQSKRTQQLETLLRTLLAIPAELLSLKDFTILTTSSGITESALNVATVTKWSNRSNNVNTTNDVQQTGDVKSVLVLRRECQSDNNNTIHWITGGTERDLLVTYPLPYEKYENLSAAPL